MNKTVAAFVCGFACTAMAQIGDYMGPGVMSNGAGTIGQRSGEQLDLRFYAAAMGVYDNGIEPFALKDGQLYTVNGLYGEQVSAGIYGQHTWKQALLGLDISGNYYHYDNDSQFDSSSAYLGLGYTYQKSRRLLFTLRGTAGTSTYGYGEGGYYEGPVPGQLVGQQSALLFNNRIFYLQGGAQMTYLFSPRTSLTVGGQGFTSQYQAAALIGVYGYNLSATLQHRLTRRTTVGATYQRMQFDFVKSYGYSSLNVAQLFYATALGKRWTLALNAGAFQSQVQGIQQISLNPVIAALLGQSFGYQTFQVTDYYPSGNVRLTGKFKTSELTFSYMKFVAPGNGIYLTSREDTAGASYSYTGIRKWNFGASGNYYRLNSLGQSLAPYSTYGGGAGFTYNLARAFHVVARYDYRRQDIVAVGFRRDASRVTAGLAWSPGDVPLSLW
ncbi:MAG TPA: hypothetical protein VMB85_07200 [Bryobacteraceae bacterium]|nr:hypothetical protein [Bryobacteraceae bacterium]